MIGVISSILIYKTFRNTTLFSCSILIGIIGFIIYDYGFEDNPLNPGVSFATITMNNNVDLSLTAPITKPTDSIETFAESQSASTTKAENASPFPELERNVVSQQESDDLMLSNPFYTSNNSILLNKFNLHSGSDSTATKDLQIFYELGLINNLETVHNIGYYIEESKSRAPLNGTIVYNQITNSSIDNRIKFAKGTGFYVSTDADIIGWNAYDQVISYSGNMTKYLGIIYFSTNEIPGGKLSSLNNKAGIYEYDLYSNGSAVRNIWLWPYNTTTTTVTNNASYPT